VPIGFGILDYVVVSLVTAYTIFLLAKAPQRLLFLLPTFLTIDFFIPLGTQLTPSRLVPLLLGCWLVLTRRFSVPRPYSYWLLLLLVVVALSLGYATLIDDAGLRPFLRALNYVSLAFLFVFVFRMLRSERCIDLALQGVVIAGAIHGAYAFYQILASKTGLPFRGIVYDESGPGIAVEAGVGGLIRVNGFADEPKRLGYVLLCGALAALYFLWRRFTSDPSRLARYVQSHSRQRQWSMLILAVGCVSMSVLTFSFSYFISAALTVLVLIATLSFRMISLAALVAAAIAVAALFFPGEFEIYAHGVARLAEAREQEFSRGIHSEVVYRQEFFANEYVGEDPWSLFLGLGLGRYNKVLYDVFGVGAGYLSNGAIAPLNAQHLEIGFDLGFPGLLILYFGGAILVYSIGRRSLRDYVLSTMLLFMLIQSLFISNLHLLIFLFAVAAGVLAARAMLLRAARAQGSLRFPPRLASSRDRSHESSTGLSPSRFA
jgi:hypothetical protein